MTVATLLGRESVEWKARRETVDKGVNKGVLDDKGLQDP